LALREFGPTSLPAYVDTSAEIRSLNDTFAPPASVLGEKRMRELSKQLAEQDEKPYWYLGDLPKPSWFLGDLNERRRRHGRTHVKT
jgi:hypothetical protein